MIHSKRKKDILLVGCLIFVDILIKLIVHFFFMEKKLLITDWLGFVPLLNTTQLSIFNNELGLGISTGVLIVLNAILLVVLPYILRWLKKQIRKKKFLDYAAVLFYSGIICSLIDKVFWGGSLDYILACNQVVDAKDIYLGAGLCFYFIALITEALNEKNKKHRQHNE